MKLIRFSEEFVALYSWWIIWDAKLYVFNNVIGGIYGHICVEGNYAKYLGLTICITVSFLKSFASPYSLHVVILVLWIYAGGLKSNIVILFTGEYSASMSRFISLGFCTLLKCINWLIFPVLRFPSPVEVRGFSKLAYVP